MSNLNDKDIILIPAKGYSRRCPGKNMKLLKWTVDYLKDNSYRVVVITDSDDIIEEVKKYNINYFKSSITTDEISAMLDYINQTTYQRDYFIYLPLTQPLREVGLIEKLDQVNTDKDFVVSQNTYVNRGLFTIKNNKFLMNSFERKGCLCSHDNSIDGAIYKIKVDFLKKITKSNSVNHEFWSGDFDTITNNMPFLDIDEISDLDCFYNLLNLFK